MFTFAYCEMQIFISPKPNKTMNEIFKIGDIVYDPSVSIKPGKVIEDYDSTRILVEFEDSAGWIYTKDGKRFDGAPIAFLSLKPYKISLDGICQERPYVEPEIGDMVFVWNKEEPEKYVYAKLLRVDRSNGKVFYDVTFVPISSTYSVILCFTCCSLNKPLASSTNEPNSPRPTE